MDTPLTQLLGCRYPIVQTAMGWIADARLVAATSNAGGFGFLAAATMSTPELEAAIAQLRQLTPQRFGVNFHMFQPNAADVIEVILKNRDRLRAVSYGRGPDAKTIRRFKDAGVLCMPTVGALKHAQKAVELGADIITVQGAEGGGHTGSVPTTLLLPQVLNAVKVPVVAAGGFHDGRGLAGALAFGAAGIAMGTRFLMTAESPVPRSTLEKYLEVNDPARIRASTAVDGLPQHPALVSAWKWKARTRMTVGHMIRTFFGALREGDSAIQTMMAANAPVLIQRAMVEGKPDEGVLPSGQVAAVIASLPPVAEVIGSIVSEAHARLASLAALSPERLATPASGRGEFDAPLSRETGEGLGERAARSAGGAIR